MQNPMLSRALRLPERKAKARWDIQGLRALAVMAVVADHLFAYPHGGFVGVDVFFVISGFLITGLLLREHQATGHISLTGFYRRRVKRIIPAAVLVLVTTVVATRLTFNAARAHDTLVDSIWTLFFGANWRHYLLSTDYFNANSPTSPLQHYWSLSIEEQFYFVWPWLMLAILLVLAHRGISRRVGRVVVGTTIATLSVASFAYAVWQTNVNVSGAYFSSWTRVWELGVGATLAVAAPLCHRIPDAIRPVLAWAGLLSIIGSLWVVNSANGFPAPAAAWPVLSTALVITAGTYADHRRQVPGLAPLTNRLSTYVGDISYSLYLWHFPVIIIGLAVWADDRAHQLALLAPVFVLSIASYHLWEDQIRRDGFFQIRPGHGSTAFRRWRRSTIRWRNLPTWYPKAVLALLVAVAVPLVVYALKPIEAPRAIAAAVTPPVPQRSAGESTPQRPALAALQTEMAAALSSTEWPTLEPSIDDVIESSETSDALEACGLASAGKAVDQCVFGNPAGKHTVVTVGDSISLSYTGALDHAFRDTDWRVIPVGTFGCPFTDATLDDLAGSNNQSCPGRKQRALGAIAQLKPDIVVFSNLSLEGTMDESEMGAEFAKELKKISGAQAILLITTPPEQPAFSKCYTRTSSPSDCAAQISDRFSRGLTQLDQVAADLPNAQVLNTSELFCYENWCPPFVGQTPVFIDGRHMTTAYQQKVAPALLEELSSNGMLPAQAR